MVLGLFEYGQIGILKETTVAIFDLSIRTFLYRARNYGALLYTHDRYSHTYGAVATVGRASKIPRLAARFPSGAQFPDSHAMLVPVQRKQAVAIR
jgi:hypothetical protein